MENHKNILLGEAPKSLGCDASTSNLLPNDLQKISESPSMSNAVPTVLVSNKTQTTPIPIANLPKSLFPSSAMANAVAVPSTSDSLLEPQAKRRRTDRNRKSNLCKYCQKAFRNSWDLRNHERIHTHEKPFVCPFKDCQRGFNDCSNLRAHQRAKNHHQWEHQCFVCGKAFIKANCLARHTLEACRKELGRVIAQRKGRPTESI